MNIDLGDIAIFLALHFIAGIAVFAATIAWKDLTRIEKELKKLRDVGQSERTKRLHAEGKKLAREKARRDWWANNAKKTT